MIPGLTCLILGLVFSVGRVSGQTPAEEGRAAALERSIRAIVQGTGEVAVAYVPLREGGEPVYLDADRRFHPASTMKVPVMMEVFREAGAGTLSLDDRITLANEFTSVADGSRFALKAADDSELTLYRHLGEERRVRELVRLMITESSNLATNLLVERVTPARVSELMRSLGAGELRVLRGVEDGRAFARGLNNEATARSLASILRQLAARQVVSAKASDEMLAILRDQKFNEGIPAGLPAQIPVAHKTGTITGVYHDAAVVEPPGRAPYVLVVLTRAIDDRVQAQKLVARISRAVYEHERGR